MVRLVSWLGISHGLGELEGMSYAVSMRYCVTVYWRIGSASLSGSSAQRAIKATISGCLGPARSGAKAGPADVYFRLSEFYPFYPYRADICRLRGAR